MKDRSSLVWDLPTRVFHWLLVLCLAGSWITAEAGFEWTEWHFRLGYASLTLVLFRLVWGLVGPRHARFASFLTGPARFAAGLRSLFKRTPGTDAGHTAAGGWAVLLMIVLVGIQASTGLFISDDIFYAGPYNGTVSSSLAGKLANVHHLNFSVLQVVIVAHVAVIAWYRFGRNTPLTAAMLHGHKVLPEALRDQAITSSKVGLALLVLAAAAAAVTALVQLAPPPAVPDYF